MRHYEDRALTDIRPDPNNPASRTTVEKLRTLLESIRQHGVIVPIIVRPDGLITDGHRRFTCASALGHRTIPAIVDDGVSLVDINRAVLVWRGAEYLEWYLSGHEVPLTATRNIRALERIGGRDLLLKLRDAGMSHTIAQEHRNVCRFLGVEPHSTLGIQAMHWLIDGQRQYTARLAIVGGITPARLKEDIQAGRDVTRRWE